MMYSRRFFAVALVGIVSFWCATPAHAGGWAVVTMDALPATFTAGQEYTFGFTMRQHGVTPRSGEASRITFTHAESGQTLGVRAADAGPTGHYTARVTLPAAGTWQWKVQSFGEHPMPPLTVVAAGGGTTAAPERPIWLFVAIPALAAVAAAGFLVGVRGRRTPTPTLALR